MGPVILPIWGPIAIQAYGLFIALGAIAFLTLIQRDKRFITLNLKDSFNTIFMLGIVAVLVGGRFLHVLTHFDEYNSWLEWFALWEPGFAALGSILCVLFIIPVYLFMHKIPMLPFLDLVATYAPLLQSIARLGCFFAGCCFGCITTVPWHVTYTHPASLAPLDLSLHPSQLYSAGLLFLLFLFMYFIARIRYTRPGQQATLYLIGAATERFITDFWRGDREMVYENIPFSLHQLIALSIIVCALVGYAIYVNTKK